MKKIQLPENKHDRECITSKINKNITKYSDRFGIDYETVAEKLIILGIKAIVNIHLFITAVVLVILLIKSSKEKKENG